MKSSVLIIVAVLTFGAMFLGLGNALNEVFSLNQLFGFRLSRHIEFQKTNPTTPTPQPVLPTVPPTERGFHVPVLLYHYIENAPADDKTRVGLSTPPKILDEQLQILEQHGYTTITFDELTAAMGGKFILPNKPVILTFDDGYADFYVNAFPILQKHNMKAVAFIPTGLMGGGNYMTWSQIETLSHSPNVVFAAHSVHHYYLPKVSGAILTQELMESKKTLEQHVDYLINWMAYPYGAFDNHVVEATKKAGFLGSATTMAGTMQYASRLFYVPRERAGRRLGDDFLKLVR